MRDDKIRNALMKITPDEALSRRVDAMVDAADLTPREPAVRRVKRPAKAMLIAAAIVVMMAMAVSAVGVFARLFYLPGAGLVDESGVLVIKEDDIGDLDVVAYRTATELELGGYVIESVTYTEYEGTKSYTIWSRMGDEMIAEFEKAQQAHIGVTVADHVISDLALTLSDGTILTPESTRYSHSGSIVYHFAADVLDTNVIISSERIGEAIPVQLCLVEGAGYSYMEYPTDQGITLILCPMNAEFSEFKLNFIDNSIADGLGDYVKTSTAWYESEWLGLYDGNGNPITTSGWSTLQGGMNTDLMLTLSDKVPAGGYDIKTAQFSSVFIQYILQVTEEETLFVALPMPADGERIDADIVIFDKSGFDVRIKGYSREGNNLTFYAESWEQEPGFIDPPGKGCLAIAYNGTNGCSKAFAHYTFGLNDADGETVRCSSSNSGGWKIGEDGLYYYTREYRDLPNDTLDSAEYVRVGINMLSCLFDGNWTITY